MARKPQEGHMQKTLALIAISTAAVATQATTEPIGSHCIIDYMSKLTHLDSHETELTQAPA